MLTAALCAWMQPCEGVVLLAPDDGSFLATDRGSGAGFVAWDGITVFGAMFDFSGAPYGYMVEDATDRVVENEFIDASPVHFTASSAFFPGRSFYLATSEVELDLGESVAGLTWYESERFGVPEPGKCALITGLGLVGLAACRRFRRVGQVRSQ